MRRPPSGFRWLIPLIGSLAVLAAPAPTGLSLEGQRVLAVIVLAIGLWGLEAMPPGVTGVVTIVALEQEVGWTNFFVIAASLSLAQALSRSGASDWLAGGVVGAVHGVAESPGLVVGVLLVASSVVRLVIPNITGFLATTIPVAMSVGTASGLNPVICGLIVTIAGTPSSITRHRARRRWWSTSAGISPRARSSASGS